MADVANNLVREVTPAVIVTTGSPNALPTLTALKASTASAVPGKSVTLTATVSDLAAGGPTPNGGMITFSDQHGVIGSELLVDGVATFTTASLPNGADTITASYSGTAEFAPSTTGTIVTAAGNGIAGYSGDGGPATDAEALRPGGVAVDSAGDLFVTEGLNNVEREVVKATGEIITVAGNGSAGYSGDNGPATDAQLNGTNSVAVDSAGDLFLSDSFNNRIREVVMATGDIITIAGNGISGYSGDGRPAIDSELANPLGIAVDSASDVFFADPINDVIREVVKATGDIITVAGNGKAGYIGDNRTAIAAELNLPDGIAVDSAGNLFIADDGNNVIREVVKATGDIITVVGNGAAGYTGDDGPATDAELNGPNSVAVDSVGDLFISDNANVVREVVKATGDIIPIAGNGTAGYSGDGGAATAAELNGPNRFAVDSAGDVFFPDVVNNVVREITPAVTVTISLPPPPAKLVIHTQPSPSATAGQAFAVQPVIYVEDGNGNLETGDNSTVVSVVLASAKGVPEGATSVTVKDGVATFAGLNEITAGPIALLFSGDGLTAGPSNSITVSPGTPFRLAISTQPSTTATAGQTFGTQPVIDELDLYGNLETGDSNTLITAAVIFGNGPLLGTNTAALVGGVATFTNLAGSAVGTIALGFSGGGHSVGPSNQIVISSTPPTLSSEPALKVKLKNSKGKPTGKTALEFSFKYSTTMNQASAKLSSNYQVETASIKGKGKRKTTTYKKVNFTESFNPQTNTVTLTVTGNQPFTSGGRIIVNAAPPNGVASSSGVPLGSDDADISISKKAKSITVD